MTRKRYDSADGKLYCAGLYGSSVREKPAFKLAEIKFQRIAEALDLIIEDRRIIAEKYKIPYTPPSVRSIILNMERNHTDGLYDQYFVDVAAVLLKYIEEGLIRWDGL